MAWGGGALGKDDCVMFYPRGQPECHSERLVKLVMLRVDRVARIDKVGDGQVCRVEGLWR